MKDQNVSMKTLRPSPSGNAIGKTLVAQKPLEMPAGIHSSGTAHAMAQNPLTVTNIFQTKHGKITSSAKHKAHNMAQKKMKDLSVTLLTSRTNLIGIVTGIMLAVRL